jgi:hypothetical protein
VLANGYLTTGKLNLLSGLAVGTGATFSSPGLRVTSGGMTLVSGNVLINGNSAVAAGAVSIATAAATGGVLDVETTAAANLLTASVTSGTTGNLISLLAGATTLFRVRPRRLPCTCFLSCPASACDVLSTLPCLMFGVEGLKCTWNVS